MYNNYRQGHISPAPCSDEAFRPRLELVSWLGEDHDVYYVVMKQISENVDWNISAEVR